MDGVVDTKRKCQQPCFIIKEIIIACGIDESGSPSSVMFMDEESYFTIHAPTFAKIEVL